MDDWFMIFGVLIGLIISLLILIAVLWWRRGRAVRKGRHGEKIVAKELRSLKRHDYIVINDLLLPTPQGHTSQIDHVVVSTKGIFVVETKSHAGRIVGSEFSQYWTQHLSSQSRQFYNPLLQNAAHIRVLRRLLPEIDVNLFVSVVVFTEAWRLDIKAEDIIEKRTFLPNRHIHRTFIPSERRKKHWWSLKKEVRLDEHRIVAPLDELRAELKRRKRTIPHDMLHEIVEKIEGTSLHHRRDKREHRKYAQATSRTIAREIRQGNCPRCGGRLVVKRGPKGEFVGCENYPNCRFTCSIDQIH